MSSPAPAIRAVGLSKTYSLGFFMNKKVRALNDLSMEINDGEIFGLLGPNGAGKSTTIKILMNLVQPTSGDAFIYGRPASEREARTAVGFLPENPNPYEYLTGEEFVVLAGRLHGLSGKALDQRVKSVLGRVGMERHSKLQIRRYSKGMVQRIGLAQAIVHQPKLLILDEPTSGLDPVGRREMRDLILEERARGTTVLFCTHIIPDVESLCDRVAVLTNGQLARQGSVQELLTTQVPTVEITVEGLRGEQIQNLGVPVQKTRALGERLLLSVADQNSQGLIRATMDAGGRVVKVAPERFSLEDLFLQALSESKHGSVGGVLS